MSKPTMVPFVKWVGGKRQIANKLKKRIPKTFNTYYEPFVGGGAFFFELHPKRAVINDLNKELINAYKTIKTSYKRLREYLLLMEYGHSEDLFRKVRLIDRNNLNNKGILSMNDSKELRAARFIYLNKAGFNGLYRVNSLGHFNVPSGQKHKVKTHDLINLKTISSYLKNNNIQITNKTYEKVLQEAQKNDFVYFDPPYDYEKGVAGFDSYQKGKFGTKGQIKLAKICHKLNSKGVKFMLSNNNTKLIQDLYKSFNIEVIYVQRLLGSKVQSRKKVEEVLITNYEQNK